MEYLPETSVSRQIKKDLALTKARLLTVILEADRMGHVSHVQKSLDEAFAEFNEVDRRT